MANSQTPYSLPAVINPSPQSTALTRYGDYPMSSYNGLTDITIPIHSIVGRALTMPISISFHASGRMADEPDGLLGIRWTLNCGGLVTRTMKGYPDEWNQLAPFDATNYAETSLVPPFDTLYSACTDGKISGLYYSDPGDTHWIPMYDSEFDIFNYVLPNGKQGRFILKNVNGAKVPMIIPYEPLAIELIKDTSFVGSVNGYIERINITDIDGTVYIFGKIDTTTVNAVEKSSEPDKLNGSLGLFPTGWYLSRIVSSDRTDSISLSYNTRSIDYYTVSQTATIHDQLRDADAHDWLGGEGYGDTYFEDLKDYLGSWHYEESSLYTETRVKDYVPTLKKINYQGGSATLNYSSNLLTGIVLRRDTTCYKKILFESSMHTRENLHYLDSILFLGESLADVGDKYAFQYYDPEIGQEFGSLSESAQQRDWWGYYGGFGELLSGQNVRISRIPGSVDTTSYYQHIGFSPLFRDPSESAKKLGMIKTISYPTGGKTEFIYEGNRYDLAPYYSPPSNTTTVEGPGLRIKEIISSPVVGASVHKIYKYGVDEDGRGHINPYLIPGTEVFNETEILESNTIQNWTSYFGSGYGGINQLGYRTRQFFCDPYITFDFSSGMIKYDGVAEYLKEGDSLVQKVKTLYTWHDNDWLLNFNVSDLEEVIGHPRKYFDPQDSWLTPVPYEKILYAYKNGVFDTTRKESYVYSSDNRDYAWDMPTYLHTNSVYAIVGAGPSGYSGAIDNYLVNKNYHEGNCSIYGYGYRKYTTGIRSLLSSKVEEYEANQNLVSENSMTYDSVYLYFLKSQQNTGSRGEVIKKTTVRPFERSDSIFQAMVARNILDPVIVQKTTVDNQMTEQIVNTFFEPHLNMFVPQSVQVKKGNFDEYTAATFNRYDSFGNILEQQKANDVKEVYLWGYASRYPVAKVLGSDYLTVSGLVNQAVLDNPSSDTALRNQLNNLRTIPGALVFTYTYKPLVGMTSETDPNGKTIYYQYDQFNRLSLVRDQDFHILKKICYNYAGQPEDCIDTATAANWQLTGITRCKPCPLNDAYTTDTLQRQQRDFNTESVSYDQIRWIDDGVSGTCVISADWQNTANTRCQKDGSNQNTGYWEQEQSDANPCSGSYGQTRWVTTIQDTISCPLASCNSVTCEAGGPQYMCINGTCTEANVICISSVRVLVGSGHGSHYVWQNTYQYCWTGYASGATFMEEETGSCSPILCAD